MVVMKKRQCRAKSKQSGKRCKQPPIPGGKVCHYHGGAAPQVKLKAEQRIALLVDPALDALSALVRDKWAPRTRLGAARDVLDRAGYGATKRLEQRLDVGGGLAMEESEELTTETLTADEATRLKELMDSFESGAILTRKEQAELHELRSRAGKKKWLRIQSGEATFHIPDNNRD